MIVTSNIHKLRERRHNRYYLERRGKRCVTKHTNGISDDVLKVAYGNGDNGSRRLRGDGSHWLDALSVSNVSNGNENS